MEFWIVYERPVELAFRAVARLHNYEYSLCVSLFILNKSRVLNSK